MIRLAACLCIVFGGALAGETKAQDYRKRRRELESALELIRLLELELTYRKDSLYKIFAAAAQQKPCIFATLLECSSEKLRHQCTLQEAWNRSLRETETTSFTDEDLQILQDFILGLGRSDTSGQKKLLEPVKVRLMRQLEDAREAESQKGRMYRGLGLSAGILTAIIIV